MIKGNNYFNYYKTNEFIEQVSKDMKDYIITMADEKVDYEWEYLLASEYLRYEYEGDRAGYESIYFRKRKALGFLVLGFLLTKDTKYLMSIVNGIYSICEESTWVVPAHGNIIEETKDAIIHDPDHVVIDLFSSETGSLISFTYFLLEEELDKITPLIRKRMKKELDHRIIHPYVNYDHYWWMGIREEVLGEHVLNNWNPWCNMNCLIALLLTEENEAIYKKGIEKCVQSVNTYISKQSEDGGCDEGASYWGHAAGNLYFISEYLKHATNGEVNFFENPKVKNMGLYIIKAHIGGDYFIPYADCSVKNTELPLSIVYKFGEIYHHCGLKELAKSLYESPKKDMNRQSWLSLGKVLLDLESFLVTGDKKSEILYDDVWLKDTEVMCTREHPNGKGFFLSCKGSHNGESHNHNDIGNYVVYYNGKPMIIDVGVGTYTKDTFSEKRYEIWTMQSAFHNVPTINGHMQKEGSKYHSENALFYQDEDLTSLSLDIQKAYPIEAGIDRWNRKVIMDKKNQRIKIIESFDLNPRDNHIVINMMTKEKPVSTEDGFILLPMSQSEALKVEYPKEMFQIEIEEILLQDEKLRKSLNDTIYRIQLTANMKKGQKELEFIIEHN